jgi:hypothetical protein
MKRFLLVVLVTMLLAGTMFCFLGTGLGHVISDDTVELARRTGCGAKQHRLYLLLEEYKKSHGELPSTLSQLVDEKYMRMKNLLFCPEASSGWIGRSYYGPQPSSDENIRLYEYFPENYGDPNSVLISESEKNHSQGLILMYIQPVVIQTMGNGVTITRKLCKEQ